MTLRRELIKKNAKALSVVHVGAGIFDSRLAKDGEHNDMITIKKEFEKTGGRFAVHDAEAELFPGVWLTGPVPWRYPERNWSDVGLVRTSTGLQRTRSAKTSPSC